MAGSGGVVSGPHRLFVYGSLQPGGRNGDLLAAVEGCWSRGVVRGRLVERGWGAPLGYPAMVLDPDAGEVRGWLFTSHHLAELWNMLDAFEGQGYERVEVGVEMDDGSSTDAFAYVAAREPP